ncbi:MAG TPA: pilus assembly protein TadG-related protein [Acidobacteriaceae bacterium]|nr:pilus assembly protein TadG-related protein [Acidobacteriaceae bacterium]
MKGLLMRLRWEDDGQTIVLVAMSFVGLLAFAGLAVDLGGLRVDQRQVQSIADASAVAGALELSTCGGVADCSAMTTAAQDALSGNGYSGSVLVTQCGSTSGDTLSLTVNNGPCALGSRSADPNYGNAQYVETVVSEVEPTIFARAIGIPSVIISARAEAGVGSSQNCLYVGDGGMTLNGGTVTLACGVNDNGSLMADSGATLDGENDFDVHSSVTNNGASITPSVTPNTPTVTDPLAGLTVPTPASTCTSVSPVNSGSPATLSPGTYCGVNLNSGASLTLNPGTYVFEGSINVGSGATLSGTGVTLYFTSGTLQPNSSSTITLSAPTSGEYAGILIWESSSNSTGMDPDSDSTSSWQGAIYLPDATLTLNSASNVAAYTIIDAYSLIVDSGANFNIGANYSSLTGGSPIKGGTAVLTE